MDVATFLRQRPEFETAPHGMVVGALAEAAIRTSAADWGTAYETALAYTAADILWTSPYGVAMRLDGGDTAEVSRYRTKLAAMRLERIPRVMVL